VVYRQSINAEGDIVKIAAQFGFEAAHRLPNLPDGHKCKNLHGHNYRLEVSVEGPLDERGFVMDYAELEDIVDPIIKRVDHRFLNEIDGLENPTSEVMAAWFMAQIKPHLPGKTVTLRIYETPRYWVEFAA
jgi:6-pyruvoyltetrahydropterin/6-carboxytetrahydropterin synthase